MQSTQHKSHTARVRMGSILRRKRSSFASTSASGAVVPCGGAGVLCTSSTINRRVVVSASTTAITWRMNVSCMQVRLGISRRTYGTYELAAVHALRGCTGLRGHGVDRDDARAKLLAHKVHDLALARPEPACSRVRQWREAVA